ncbi:MAG TPA: amidohydrolase family protein [Candidatus Limnocylindria bacterium]
MSLVLRGGTVVRSLDPPVVERADVHVDEGRIVATTDAGTAEAIDCSGCLVMPGNACAHTHAYSALARGMPFRLAPPASFLEILQRIWWRLDRALDPAAIRASALLAARDALRAGTTTLVDHHASPNAIDGSLDILAEAFEELGLRGVLAYEVTDRDGASRAQEGIDENARFLRRVSDRRWPLARGLVGAHASFTLSPDSLGACVELAERTGTGLHIHLAEDQVDQADAEARFGLRATARLAEVGALTPHAVVAHAVHLVPAEAELLRSSGATVAHNPRSNMNNGVGRAPLDWLGDRVALGTDGIGADMFEEARSAHFRRREETLAAPPDWPLPALANAARAAGRAFDEPRLGRIEPGAPADLVVLESAIATPVEADNLAGQLVFGLAAASVRDVLVAGVPVVRDRRLALVDEDEILATARAQAARLWERMDELPAHPFSPARLLATAGGT